MEHSVVLVPELDGQTTAILEDANLSVTAPTPQEALDRLRYRMERIQHGEVERVSLDLPVASVRQQALEHLREAQELAERVLHAKVERSDLELAEEPRDGLAALAGTFSDDPDLLDLVKDAYAARDRESE